MDIEEEICKEISKILEKDFYEINKIIVKNESISRGNFSLPCFKFANEFKEKPENIATKIKEQLNLDYIEKSEVIGGFLNIYIKKDIYIKNVLEKIELEGEKYGSTHNGVGKKTLVEHTSINPNASPHIGRARNAILGDSIVNILKFNDYDVEVHYFVNDIGKQIAMPVIAGRKKDKFDFEDLLQMYVEMNKEIKENQELEKEVFDILDKLENGDKTIIEEFRKLVKICVDGQTEIFKELGIYYDYFDCESDFILNGDIEKLLNDLKETNMLFEAEDGRLAINQEAYNIPVRCPVLCVARSNKTSLYPLRDIAYTIYKDKIGKDRNIVILGEDQRVYFKQITAALDLLGYKEPEVVHYSFVLLPDGKMSTRNGTVVLLKDFMNEVLEKAKQELQKRDEIIDIEKAKKIAYGTVKYTILKSSLEKNIIFNIEEAMNFNGDTSLYIQYNYARIISLLEKANNVNMTEKKYELLKEDVEMSLVQKLDNFKNVMSNASEKLAPNLICNYVYDLTKSFANYYHDYSILNAENEDIKCMRLQLVKSIGNVIKISLNILGIDVIDRI